MSHQSAKKILTTSAARSYHDETCVFCLDEDPRLELRVGDGKIKFFVCEPCWKLFLLEMAARKDVPPTAGFTHVHEGRESHFHPGVDGIKTWFEERKKEKDESHH